MPLTRTRTGAAVPAGPGGGENEKSVPDGSMLTSPGAGAADGLRQRRGADEHLRGARDEACTVHGERGRSRPAPGPPAGFTYAATLTGVEPVRVAPGVPSAPLPTRSW